MRWEGMRWDAQERVGAASAARRARVKRRGLNEANPLNEVRGRLKPPLHLHLHAPGQIDTAMDDGQPSSGSVRLLTGSAASGNAVTAAELTDSGQYTACASF